MLNPKDGLLLISVIAILWDRFTGWKGWSVDFVIPFGILASASFLVPVIAKINRLEREEYLFYLVQAGIAGLDSDDIGLDWNRAVCRTFSNLCRNQFSDIGCTVYLLQEGYDAGVS